MTTTAGRFVIQACDDHAPFSVSGVTINLQIADLVESVAHGGR